MSADIVIEYGEILEKLGLERIDGIEFASDHEIKFRDVYVDTCDCDVDCDVCHGSPPDPEHEVNSALIEDFIAACVSGDTMTARALVGRVFEDRSDAALAEKCLGKLL